MAAEYSSFSGWERNLKLSNGFAEVVITLEVGPRIISYRPAEGRSVFKLVGAEAGKSNEEMWKIRGGHRLWTAPEDFGKRGSLCYALDNSEVEHLIEDEFTVRVSNRIDGADEDSSGDGRRLGKDRSESRSGASNHQSRRSARGGGALGAYGHGGRWLCGSLPATAGHASGGLLAQSLDRLVAVY